MKHISSINVVVVNFFSQILLSCPWYYVGQLATQCRIAPGPVFFLLGVWFQGITRWLWYYVPHPASADVNQFFLLSGYQGSLIIILN